MQCQLTNSRPLAALAACCILLVAGGVGGSKAPGPVAGWSVFRGNTAGSGVATSPLPDKLEMLWTFKAKDSFFQATAVVVDGVVYVGDVDRKFYALDLKTGKELWSYKVEIGFTSAAAVRDGHAYIGVSDGIFYCLDAKTGKLVWKHETGAEINSSANFYKDSVLVGSQSGALYRFNAKDGKVIWEYMIKASGGIQCSPTLAGNRCFVAGCDGQLHVIDVDKGESVSTLPIGDPTLATPAIDGDTVFFGTEGAVFMAVDWRKPEIRWKYEHPKRQLAFRSSAAATAGAVIVGGRNKIVHALDPQTGKALWTFTTKGRVDSSPVVAGKRVYAGSSDGRLYVLDLKTGDELWQFDGGGGFTASPAIAYGRLVIGSDDGTLYCFGKKD